MDEAPVIYTDPITDEVELIIEMITTYCPYATFLRLEEAAKVAAIRDSEAADNLLQSIHTEYLESDGTGTDFLAIEPPSLR